MYGCSQDGGRGALSRSGFHKVAPDFPPCQHPGLPFFSFSLQLHSSPSSWCSGGLGIPFFPYLWRVCLATLPTYSFFLRGVAGAGRSGAGAPVFHRSGDKGSVPPPEAPAGFLLC